MDSSATPSPTSLEIARRLLAREARATAGELETGAALQRACLRVIANLRDAMGEDGCTALLARALARTEASHAAVKTIRRLNAGDAQLDGVAASIEAHGLPAVTAAIEALLAALIDVLTRLIGEDMTIGLMDHDAHGRGWAAERTNHD